MSNEQTFSMFDDWQPNGNFPKKILIEFKCFWCAKPDIKKTQDQWHKALTQSYEYAISRGKARNPAVNSLGWWRDD